MENWLRKASEDVPDKIAVKYSGETITYKALYEQADVLSRKIKSLGQNRLGVYIDRKSVV